MAGPKIILSGYYIRFGWPTNSVYPFRHLCKKKEQSGTPGGGRTHTCEGLNLVTLPIGLQEQ